jgi:hypothetical protein
MSVTHSTATRTALADTAVDRLDLGSANAAGHLVFKTTGGSVLATLILSNPAFGSASAGTATASAITSDTNAAGTGTATKFELQDRDAVAVILGSVGNGSGGDINLSSNVITAGDTVSMSSLTYSAAA